MTFKKRLEWACGGAAVASFAGSFIVLMLVETLRSMALISLIISAVCFVICLILAHVLEGKPSRKRVPVFVAVLIVYLISLGSFMIYQLGLHVVFRPHIDQEAYEELSDMSGKVTEISSDGISGWRISAANVPEDAKRPVILYFGGNGEDSAHKTRYIIDNSELSFLYQNYDHIFLDYPGYGNSEGTISEQQMREFALKAYDIVASMETTGSVTVLSYSLGNGPAVYLASSEEASIDRLILMAPYYSGYDLFNAQLDIFHGPLRLLVAYKMPVYRYASTVTCPVSIIASSDDEVIPIESSRNLFGCFNGSSVNFINVEGVLHNDFWSDPSVLDNLENILEAR